MTEALRLTEPVPIDDDLCTGLALVEDVGIGLRFVVYATQTCYEDGSSVSVVKRKIVIPVEAVMPAIDLTLAALARRGVKTAGQRLLRRVK
jgi:hypothetical protein